MQQTNIRWLLSFVQLHIRLARQSSLAPLRCVLKKHGSPFVKEQSGYKSLRNADMYVVRANFQNSRPCLNCAIWMHRYGIKRVFYSWEGLWRMEHIRDLIDSSKGPSIIGGETGKVVIGCSGISNIGSNSNSPSSNNSYSSSASSATIYCNSSNYISSNNTGNPTFCNSNSSKQPSGRNGNHHKSTPKCSRSSSSTGSRSPSPTKSNNNSQYICDQGGPPTSWTGAGEGAAYITRAQAACEARAYGRPLPPLRPK